MQEDGDGPFSDMFLMITIFPYIIANLFHNNKPYLSITFRFVCIASKIFLPETSNLEMFC